MPNISEIRRSVKLSDYLASCPLHIEVKNGRCAAKWRGGERDSVSIDDSKGTWCDHGNNDEGGDLFKLVQVVEGIDFLPALRLVCERFNIRDEQKKTKASREVAHYDYTDENGKPIFCVIRKEPKGFLQAHYDENGKRVYKMAGIRLVPYHLPRLIVGVAKNIRIYIVEGEKDVENLEKLGLCATCNACGAANDYSWRDEYSDFFKGAESVTIIADRDSENNKYKGQRHAKQVRESLERAGVKASVVYVGDASCKDASDWIAKGATADDFNALADNPPPWESLETSASENGRPSAAEPLRSYVFEEVTDENGSRKTKRKPRSQADVVEEIHDRFEGQPYVVTSSYSVHEGEEELSEEKDLFFYEDGRTRILHGRNVGVQLKEEMRKKVNVVDFPRGSEFIGIDDIVEALKDRHYAKRVFTTISHTPTWPGRNDAFETLKRSDLPPPSPNHEAFRNFCAMFLPATEADATLIKAFVMAPAFYSPSARTPGWFFRSPKDQTSGQSSGKTGLVEGVAALYDEIPLTILQKSLDNDDEEICKRLLSTEGVRKRFVVFDNERRLFNNEKVASMVTAKVISGRKLNAGEGGRPNDLVFCVTANDAALAADMTSRFYTITIKQPGAGADNLINEETGERETWEERRDRFIRKNRKHILADIFDRIENAPFRERPHRDGPFRNRFHKFDSCVLSGACDSDEEFFAADAAIVEAGLQNNAERQMADEFLSILCEMCVNCVDYDATVPIYVEFRALVDFCQAEGNPFFKGKTWEMFARLIENGTLANFAKGFKFLGGEFRHRAFFFGLDRQPADELMTPYQFVSMEDGVPRIARLTTARR